MIQEPGFTPIKSTPRETPTKYFTDIILPDSYIVNATNPDYILQIAEKEGLHSCLPTSVLNGLIHLGLVTQKQALSFQNTFHTTNKDMFTQRAFGSQNLEVMAVSTSILLERLKQSIGGEFPHQIMNVNGLSKEEINTLIRQQLAQDKVVIGGDQDHAVLIIGFDKDSFATVDPYKPTKSVQKPSIAFSEDIKTGEPWLTVLRK